MCERMHFSFFTSQPASPPLLESETEEERRFVLSPFCTSSLPIAIVFPVVIPLPPIRIPIVIKVVIREVISKRESIENVRGVE